jgi:DNA-binding transcriptional LysR family regulator
MADSIVEFERRVAGRDIRPTGELRVTAPEALGQRFMPAILSQFRAANPGVVVDLLLSDRVLSLSSRDADVAIRLTNDPPETLVGRRICTGRWGVYCRREIADLGTFDVVAFIGLGEAIGPAPVRRWFEANVPATRIPVRTNSAHSMLGLALEGCGAALLPCFLGDPSPDLVRLAYPLAELDTGLWLLTHADLRRSARVRAFMEFAGAELAKSRRAIEGDGSAGTE